MKSKAKTARFPWRILMSMLAFSPLIFQFGFNKQPLTAAADLVTPNISFGVISDVHLESGSQVDQQDKNLKAALTKFKDNNIKVLMVAGDIANQGNKGSYEKFNVIFNEVFPDTATAPQKVMVMGNHDYYNHTAAVAQQQFRDAFGTSLNTHIKVDGYHFIGVSTESDNLWGTFSVSTQNWLKAQLEAAKTDDPYKPIFVTFHQHIKDTVYLSDAWYTDQLNDILKDYPQVVTFSGHSHAVLDDERSIYQKDYTCVGTATLFYTELENGKEGGSVPQNAYNVAEGIIGKVTDTAVDLERYDFYHDEKIKEDWVIEYSPAQPIDKSKFRYTDVRIAAAEAPYFDEGSKITASNITSSSFTVSCNSAKDKDIVQSYRVRVINKAANSEKYNKLYFSDFYLGIPYMSNTQTFNITGLDTGKTYDVQISAIESFGKESTPLTLDVTTDDNSPAKDVMNLDFNLKDGKDSSSYQSAMENKGNPKIEMDNTLKKKVLVLDGGSFVNASFSDAQKAAMTNGFTMETVFKMNSIENQAIMECCEEGQGIGFESDGDGRVELWVNINGSYTAKKVGVPLEAGKYYHLTATYDGSKILLYLDGKQVDSLTISGSLAFKSGIPMCLGGDPDSTGGAGICLDGSIAEFRLMNKAINADEVVNHYNAFYGITPATTGTTEVTTTVSNDNSTTTNAGSNDTTTGTVTTSCDSSGPATGSSYPLAAAALAALSAVLGVAALKMKKSVV